LPIERHKRYIVYFVSSSAVAVGSIFAYKMTGEQYRSAPAVLGALDILRKSAMRDEVSDEESDFKLGYIFWGGVSPTEANVIFPLKTGKKGKARVYVEAQKNSIGQWEYTKLEVDFKKTQEHYFLDVQQSLTTGAPQFKQEALDPSRVSWVPNVSNSRLVMYTFVALSPFAIVYALARRGPTHVFTNVAKQIAQNPTVVNLLGSPVTKPKKFTGQHTDDIVNFKVNLKGSKSSGVLQVQGVRQNTKWTITSCTLDVPGRNKVTPIQLLDTIPARS